VAFAAGAAAVLASEPGLEIVRKLADFVGNERTSAPTGGVEYRLGKKCRKAE
jgi:hypothetical protein